jgi:hypothetical protein
VASSSEVIAGPILPGNIILDPAVFDVQLEGKEVGAVPGQYSDGTSTANLDTQPDPSVFVSTKGGSSVITSIYYFNVNYFLSDLPVEVIINSPWHLFVTGPLL